MLQISINMVLDTLAEYDPEPLFPADEELFFSGLRLYERGQNHLTPENIYMCTNRDLDMAAINSGCCFLCVHKVPATLRSKCEGKRVVLVEDDNISLATSFNAIQRLFTNLREWHQSMHVSLIQNNSVQELLDLSEGAIGNPIVLVDMSFRLIASTRNIQTDDEVYNELVTRGYHTQRSIDLLTRSRQVDSIKRASTVDVELLPLVTRYHTMTRTFYMNEVPYAYLRMICSTHSPTKSLEERFNLLSESVEYYLHNNYSTGNINKYIYEYVLIELIEGKMTDEAEAAERVKFVGLQSNSNYRLLTIVFADEANISLNYMLEEVRVIFPDARPFIYGSRIVMLADREQKSREEDLFHSGQLRLLQDFLAHYDARCGLSALFHPILAVRDAYVETNVAIELGTRLGPKHKGPANSARMFFYQDYLPYHLITACAQQVRLESLCDDAVLSITRRDAQKGTDYATLLHTYLANKCRPTDTGNLLHMHRNNVIYHIQRLSEQFGFDLDDPEVCLRLIISFKVRDLMQQNQNNGFSS